MTRAPSPHEPLDAANFGTPGAVRTVVVLRHGATAKTDPDPAVTARHDVRILAVGLSEGDLDDPAAYRGETPAETGAVSVAALIAEQSPDAPVGLVGLGPVAAIAARVAAENPALVDRLALVGAPMPETPASRDLAAELYETVTAETLVIDGAQDPDAASTAASWYRDRIPGARVALVGSPHDGDQRLSLGDVWDRVLAHCAPDSER